MRGQATPFCTELALASFPPKLGLAPPPPELALAPPPPELGLAPPPPELGLASPPPDLGLVSQADLHNSHIAFSETKDHAGEHALSRHACTRLAAIKSQR